MVTLQGPPVAGRRGGIVVVVLGSWVVRLKLFHHRTQCHMVC